MYICPVCKKRLKKLDNVLHCQNGHSFDIARKGYVNLLTTNKRNPKNSGDNAEMVKARTNFLDKGHYLPLAERIAQTAQRELSNSKQPVIIDSGCGEGFYTCVYARQLPEARLFGIDISKAAVSHCMTRVHVAAIGNCEFAVASERERRHGDKHICTCCERRICEGAQKGRKADSHFSVTEASV